MRGFLAALPAAAALACGSGDGSTITGVEMEDVAGFYVLASVDGQAPPVAEFPECGSFPRAERSMCRIESGRLHMQVDGGFRLVLVHPDARVAPEVVKGGYRLAGRSLTYESGVHGEFRGRVVAARDCEPIAGFGNGLTFERGAVSLTFCRDPEVPPET